jgi:hypothetical protein
VDFVQAQRDQDPARLRPVAGGDLAGGRGQSWQWDKWYRTAIPRAEGLYDDYLAERKKEMGP